MESMIEAAREALELRPTVREVSQFLADMKADIEITVDDADCDSGYVDASARGSWAFHGRQYPFQASVRSGIADPDRALSGSFAIAGLGLTVSGKRKALRKHAPLACDDEAAAWLRASGVAWIEQDAQKAAVASLEVLAKDKAVGIADIDVLAVAFGLLRARVGLKASSSADCGEEKSKEKTVEDMLANAESKSAKCGLCSDGSEDDDVASDAAGEQPTNGSAEDARDDDEDDAEGSDEAGGSGEAEADDSADDANVSAAVKENGANKPVLPEAHNDEEDEENREADNQPSEMETAVEEAQESSGEEDTFFVGESVLKAVKAKLSKGGVPSRIELERLLDVEKLPDGDDLVPLDNAKFSELFAGAKEKAASALLEFIAKHGAKQAGKLLVEAEELAAASDEDGEEETDDEGEESEEEEEGNREAPPKKKLKSN